MELILSKKLLNRCLIIAATRLFKHREPFKHFSFIIQDNKIVAVGKNRSGSALTHLGYDDYMKMHSETDAYKKARGIMNHSIPFDVVNIRLSKAGVLRGSCPCCKCYAYLKKMKCRSIWFSTDLENFARMDI